MIKLHQFFPVWDLPNASPFCMKLETYLRMAKVPYENAYVRDPRKGPKGKCPYIQDGNLVMGDSGLYWVIAYARWFDGDN